MGPPLGRVDVNALLRRLPQVDEILRSLAGEALLSRLPRWAVVRAAQEEIERLRRDLVARKGRDEAEPSETDKIAPDFQRLGRAAEALVRPSLVPVVNATGVVLHTNLGRAPLHPEAAERAAGIARGYSNLEYDTDARRRGSRHDHVAELLSTLTSAEAACVVNNNAGAVLVALATLAAGREVIVSRGELVEIGGSFRVPDVMTASNARLVEVGTTNKTHLSDYREAIGPETALVLKVHPSNFAMVGFTAAVPLEDLVALGKEQKVPVMVDLGSGTLVLRAGEPTITETLKAGVDVVTFSGDKLLGGPQSGILLGGMETIARIRRHPLLRALRPDKMTLAALETTLMLYRDGRSGEIPAIAMLETPRETILARAERLADAARLAAPQLTVELRGVSSAVGGGALPLFAPESFAIALSGGGISADALDARLRAASPPIIGRIADGVLLLDVRTVSEGDVDHIVRALAQAGVSTK